MLIDEWINVVGSPDMDPNEGDFLSCHGAHSALKDLQPRASDHVSYYTSDRNYWQGLAVAEIMRSYN